MRVTRVDGQPCGVQWGVRVGFHAIPSMDTVHLHVISDDLVSERLKHKKVNDLSGVLAMLLLTRILYLSALQLVPAGAWLLARSRLHSRPC
jgi:hypothetical protein